MPAQSITVTGPAKVDQDTSTGTGGVLFGTPVPIVTAPAGGTPAFQYASTSETGIGIYAFNADTGLPPIIRLFKSQGGEVGEHGAVGDGIILAQIASYASDGENWARCAAIRAMASGPVSAGSVPADWVIYCSTNNAFFEVARFRADKKVVFQDSIKTGAPAGGAGEWKIGKYSSGRVRVTIDGVEYDLTATPV